MWPFGPSGKGDPWEPRRGRRPDPVPRDPAPGDGLWIPALAEEREGPVPNPPASACIQDLEAANEELQSANEEILSSNEELQSANEELDAAREELQSTNEEINTVNEELQARNDELVRVNSDLVNLLSSVDIAIVIVSKDLRIRRFTPMAEHLLNLIAADVGRPDLEAMVEGVVTDVKSVERDVRDAGGDWFSLRIRPYKNLDDRIDGAVVSLVDITARRKEADGRTSAMSYAEALAEEVPRPLLVLDGELRVQRAIRRIEQVEIEHDFPSIGRRRVRLNARRIEGSDSTPLLVLSIEENEHPTS